MKRFEVTLFAVAGILAGCSLLTNTDGLTGGIVASSASTSGSGGATTGNGTTSSSGTSSAGGSVSVSSVESSSAAGGSGGLSATNTTEASSGANGGGGSSSVAQSSSSIGGGSTASSTGATGTGGGGEGGGAPSLASCGLVLEMDEASWSGQAGEVIDSSGHHNNGTAVGTTLPTTMADSHSGRAGSFTSGGCIHVPDASSLVPTTALTMAAWVRPSGGAIGIFSKRVDDMVNGQYTLFLLGDVLYADIGLVRSQDTVSSIPANEWHHVAAVFNAAAPPNETLTFYVDGQPDLMLNAGIGSIPSYVPNPDLYVGCLVTGAASPYTETFVGGIDQAAIWTRALSGQEIHDLYQLTGPI